MKDLEKCGGGVSVDVVRKGVKMAGVSGGGDEEDIERGGGEVE